MSYEEEDTCHALPPNTPEARPSVTALSTWGVTGVLALGAGAVALGAGARAVDLGDGGGGLGGRALGGSFFASGLGAAGAIAAEEDSFQWRAW
jgi:hypothetical protein